MSEYQLLCYKDKFKSYKKITSDNTRAIPAKAQDEFALLVCVGKRGEIGFRASEDSEILLGALAQGSYILAAETLWYASNIVSGESRKYALKPKNAWLESMIKEHEKYELDDKKFQIMRRHGRACPIPIPTILTNFLKSTKHPMSSELYQKIITNCYYATKEIGSGEHGFGAFEVFSDNLDIFFDDLKKLMGKTGELIFVEHSMLPYD